MRNALFISCVLIVAKLWLVDSYKVLFTQPVVGFYSGLTQFLRSFYTRFLLVFDLFVSCYAQNLQSLLYKLFNKLILI